MMWRFWHRWTRRTLRMEVTVLATSYEKLKATMLELQRSVEQFQNRTMSVHECKSPACDGMRRVHYYARQHSIRWLEWKRNGGFYEQV